MFDLSWAGKWSLESLKDNVNDDEKGNPNLVDLPYHSSIERDLYLSLSLSIGL